jgi:ABC-type dipeptide/oligopeptide/nickel transport system permease component
MSATRSFAANLAKRLLYTVPVVWLVVSLVFLLIHMIPGDPVEQMLGERAQPVEINQLRAQLGLDLPLGQQYINYWKALLHADLGTSYRFNSPVGKIIAARYPSTMLLAIAALLVALTLAVPAGIHSAVHQGKWQDRLLGFVSLLGLSFPAFALGPVLILIFAIVLGWLPVSGAAGPEYLILPAITMGSALAAILTRMVRTSMLEELNQDYVRTARAKGLTERLILYKHALRNGLIPVLTVVGLQFGALLGGAMVTETIFSWPGIGRLTLQAINSRDYPLVQGCFLTISITYVVVNLVTDLLYSQVDPRIREA